MKTSGIIRSGLILVSAAFITASASAQITLGDTLVINFTAPGNTVGGNWNEVIAPLNSPIAEGILLADMTTFAGGQSTGVSLSITAPEDAFGLGGRDEVFVASRVFPVSGTIPAAAQRRLTYHTTSDQQFVFSGLDDSLTYNLSVLSANTAGRAEQAWIANPGINQVSLLVDPDDGMVHTFANLSTNGSGVIILQSTAAGSGTNAQHLNAMELTAIPEPSTYAAILGLLAAGVIFLRRRNRN
jgi:hypothetical protein